jgi:hypothetical protein
VAVEAVLEALEAVVEALEAVPEVVLEQEGEQLVELEVAAVVAVAGVRPLVHPIGLRNIGLLGVLRIEPVRCVGILLFLASVFY